MRKTLEKSPNTFLSFLGKNRIVCDVAIYEDLYCAGSRIQGVWLEHTKK